MAQGKFDSDTINAALTSVAECFAVGEAQKLTLQSATRDQVLAAIAQTATIGTVPTVITLCLISATNAYFDHCSGAFDYDNWRRTVDDCANVVPGQIQPRDPAFEVRPGITTLLASYAAAIVAADVLERISPAPSLLDRLGPGNWARPN